MRNAWYPEMDTDNTIMSNADFFYKKNMTYKCVKMQQDVFAEDARLNL